MPMLYILMPAFNEGGTIGTVIKDLKHHGYQNILVVDDGSQDKTHLVAKQENIEVVKLPKNKGQGEALRTGIEYLRSKYSPEIIVTFDSDGQHQAEDIKALIKPLLEKRTDIVLGTRFLKPTSNIPYMRKVMLKLAVVFTRLTTGLSITDTHNGLRALSKRAYTTIAINQSRMAHASEILGEIKRHNLRYEEVPVTIMYTEYTRKKGQGIYHLISLGYTIIIEHVGILVRRMKKA